LHLHSPRIVYIVLPDMEIIFPHDPADRVNRLIEELCRALDKHARARFIEAPMLLLIWNRINGMARRFATLVKRVRAGTHKDPAPARSGNASPQPQGSPKPARAAPAAKLPRHFNWLVNLLPEAERFGGELCWVLQRPEILMLIAETPQAGRILRPLCRMLGVEPPPALLPRPLVRGAPPTPRPRPAPKPHLDDGCWPQWRGPGLLWRTEAEFWKFHKPNRGHPPNRD